MKVQWVVFSALVVWHPVKTSSDVISVLKEVRPCFNGDVEPCLLNHALRALLDAADLSKDMDGVDVQGREFSSNLEEELMAKLTRLIAYFGFSPQTVENARQSPFRTFNKAWKYLVPLLIGVKLKLAAFLPLMLAVLTIIAKSALLSGNLALLFTGLNIILKYWYPKWSQSQRVLYDHNTADYGHHDQDFSQHFGTEPYGHVSHDSQHDPKYNRRYAMFQGR